MPKNNIALLIVCICTAFSFADSTVRFDFESGDMQGCQVTDGQFEGLVYGERDVQNLQGKYLLSTLLKKVGKTDEMTGVVESPLFLLTAAKISFRVGGGAHDNTYVAICAEDGREVKKASGTNSILMRQIAWEVPELVGQKVFIRIVDKNRGGWGHVTFDDFLAEGVIDADGTEKKFARIKKQLQGKMLRQKADCLNLNQLELYVTDIRDKFPDYPADEYLQKIVTYKKQLSKILDSADFNEQIDFQPACDKIEEISRFSKELLLNNPHLRAQEIVFVVRPQYPGDHHNTATMFVTSEINGANFRPGGVIKAIDFANGGKVRTIVDAGPNGGVRDIEVSFDGARILFSMRRSVGEDYHIYEIGANGKELRQLTSMAGAADFDPAYLPDGSIVFSSTREPKYCGCNRHIMGNLFKMDGDGANIHQIAKSTLHEGHASVMSDGRILYDRWEYIDRNFGDAQGLWTVNPDGTNQSVYWGNNTASPGGVIDARQIPGSQRVVCTFTSCHDRPWGAIAVVDRRLGIDGASSVIRTWPEDAINLVDNGGIDTFSLIRPKYEDPYPLSDSLFLCSRMIGDGEKMGIYLLDMSGNETLVHAEGSGCFDPMPLRRRAVADVVPSRRDFANDKATFFVANVYEGTHMAGVESGAVKFLRVIESPEKRFWTIPGWGGQGGQNPGMNWSNFENKRILSTVPVEKDGSAYFQVPSDTYLFFQLLDEKGMMIQSMRSGTVAQSGEVTGCVGCHDNRRGAPPAVSKQRPLAMRRPPSKLNGWHGEARLFSYMKEVQPVFDKHCVKCHDYGKKAGKKLILASDRDNTFNASYVDLWMKKYINCIGAGPHATQQAYSWGSHKSKLVDKILSGHKKVKLSDEELDRIITWIDLNGPYYPSYASAYPDNLAGRSPLSDVQMKELQELTGVDFVSLSNHGRRLASQISFDRPRLSPCLNTIKDNPEKLARAVAIIEAGKKTLAESPRADMGGFAACAIDKNRQSKYNLRHENELNRRTAIRNGDKIYDQ